MRARFALAALAAAAILGLVAAAATSTGSGGRIATIAGVGGAPGSGADGFPAIASPLNEPHYMAVAHDGTIYVADKANHRVRRIGGDGIITTVAGTGVAGFSGDGGPATLAQLRNPNDVELDAAGNLYIADENNQRVRVIVNGIIITIAGSGPADASSGGFGGDGGPATSARLNKPHNLAFDRAGNLYISDTKNQRIRRVDRAGVIATVAGAGGGTGADGGAFSGDGGPATAAQLWDPHGLTFDRRGNLYIADDKNNRIRRIGRDGIISTVAGSGSDIGPNVGGFGGDGGPATGARLFGPHAVAVACDGRLFVTDTKNHRVRLVARNGTISTIVGTGIPGFAGDGGPASAAQLTEPHDVVFDRRGRLVVSDTENHVLRAVRIHPPAPPSLRDCPG